MSKFTFYWLTGKKETLEGDSPSDTLNKAGYGGGAVRALDFYELGYSDDWKFNKEQHSWVRK